MINKRLLGFLFFFIKFAKPQENCLSYDPELPFQCFACASGFFSQEFLISAGKLGIFDSRTCQKQSSSSTSSEKLFYIADSNYQSEFPSDGSITRPFQTFFDALIAGQQHSQALKATEVFFS